MGALKKEVYYNRIAFSALCGLLVVLLVLLWVRSYWRTDHVLWNSDARAFAVSTERANLTVEFMSDRVMMPLGWSHASFLNFDDNASYDDERTTLFGFGWHTENGSVAAYLPLWFLVLVCAGFASVPWLPLKRFSLRTLLIAITLVALLAGVVAVVSR